MTDQTDVVIAGAGLSGLYTALNLPNDWQITVISSYDDNSSLAQGGIASCIDPEDNFDNHIADTLKAGHYINDLSAVNHLVKNGPRQIAQLINIGVDFDTDSNGAIAATLEGGHSNRRILHVHGDQTGKGIMNTLRQHVQKRSNIRWVHGGKLLSLMKRNDQVCGITYLSKGRIYCLNSGYTILATGGLGDLFAQTTNHRGAIGTGIAVAHQAGAVCSDMRYIQFHPTAFYEPQDGHRFLITEAMRGEGAHLLDENHHRFMPYYDKRLELAPRDVVAKAIHDVLTYQKKNYVYLDTRHLDRSFLNHRFPGISRYLSERGLILGEDLIPVTPVAHYTIGGIKVDKNGQTSLRNLFASGEVSSSGVHGANRLASNSLLECLVYGNAIAARLQELGKNSRNEVPDCSRNKWSSTYLADAPDVGIISYIQRTMTRHAGIVRSSRKIKEVLEDFRERLNRYGHKRQKEWSSFYIHTMLYTAILVLEDALDSPSLGCHIIDENTNH